MIAKVQEASLPEAWCLKPWPFAYCWQTKSLSLRPKVIDWQTFCLSVHTKCCREVEWLTDKKSVNQWFLYFSVDSFWFFGVTDRQKVCQWHKKWVNSTSFFSFWQTFCLSVLAKMCHWQKKSLSMKPEVCHWQTFCLSMRPKVCHWQTKSLSLKPKVCRWQTKSLSAIPKWCHWQTKSLSVQNFQITSFKRGSLQEININNH